MTKLLSKLRIFVRPSPATHDYEVCLRDGEADIIRRFDESMIGLDPDEILTSPCALLPTDVPHSATIARCDCGVAGCGSIDIIVEREGETVTWHDPSSLVTVRFSATQYEAEVNRALLDFSWETPDRTAARLLGVGVDHDSLGREGLKYIWSSGRILAGNITIALTLDPGPYQVLVHVETRGLSPEDAATRCLEHLAGGPSSWSSVVWYPQAQGLGAPAVASSGWRKGTA